MFEQLDSYLFTRGIKGAPEHVFLLLPGYINGNNQDLRDRDFVLKQIQTENIELLSGCATARANLLELGQ